MSVIQTAVIRTKLTRCDKTAKIFVFKYATQRFLLLAHNEVRRKAPHFVLSVRIFMSDDDVLNSEVVD